MGPAVIHLQQSNDVALLEICTTIDFHENSTRCGQSSNRFKSVDVNDWINDGCDMIEFLCLPHLFVYHYNLMNVYNSSKLRLHFSLIFRYGRKITFYISVGLIMIGRVANLYTPSYFLWFAIFSVIGSLCLISLFQAPYVIAIEISGT